MPGRTEDHTTSDRTTDYNSNEAEAYAERAQGLLYRYRDPDQEPAHKEDLTGPGYENNLWHRQWHHELDPQADGQGDYAVQEGGLAGRLRAMRFAMDEAQDALAGIREVQEQESCPLIYRQDKVDADANHDPERTASYQAETRTRQAAAQLARHARGITELGIHLTYRGMVEDNEKLTATGITLMNNASQSLQEALGQADYDHPMAQGARHEQHELDHPTSHSLLNPQGADHALDLADTSDPRIAGIATRFMAVHNAMALVNQDLGNSVHYAAEQATPDEVDYLLHHMLRKNLNPHSEDNAAAAFVEACGGAEPDLALHHLNQVRHLGEFVMDIAMHGQDLAESAKLRYEEVAERLNANDREGAVEALERMFQTYQPNANPSLADQYLQSMKLKILGIAQRYALRQQPPAEDPEWNGNRLQGKALHRRTMEAAVLIESLERRQAQGAAGPSHL